MHFSYCPELRGSFGAELGGQCAERSFQGVLEHRLPTIDCHLKPSDSSRRESLDGLHFVTTACLFLRVLHMSSACSCLIVMVELLSLADTSHFRARFAGPSAAAWRPPWRIQRTEKRNRSFSVGVLRCKGNTPKAPWGMALFSALFGACFSGLTFSGRPIPDHPHFGRYQLLQFQACLLAPCHSPKQHSSGFAVWSNCLLPSGRLGGGVFLFLLADFSREDFQGLGPSLLNFFKLAVGDPTGTLVSLVIFDALVPNHILQIVKGDTQTEHIGFGMRANQTLSV